MAYEKKGGPQEFEAQGLTLKERMNHPYLLAHGILIFQRMTNDAKKTESMVRETIMALYDLIPDLWEDDLFTDDVAKAKTIRYVDMRPSFCGAKASAEWCRQHGIEPVKKLARFNHHLLMKACINLLERRGMMSRKIFKEIFTGRRFKGKAPDVSDMLEEMLQETGGR